MTQAQAQLPDPAVIYARLSQPAREKALERLAEDAATFVTRYSKALEDSLGLVKAPPADRLAYYRQMPPEALDELRTSFPKDYQQLMDDWKKLAENPPAETAPTALDQSLAPNMQVAPLPTQNDPFLAAQQGQVLRQQTRRAAQQIVGPKIGP